MKRVTVTFEVLIEDDAEYNGAKFTEDEVMKDLYDHVCEWVFNTEGTVEFINEKVEGV